LFFTGEDQATQRKANPALKIDEVTRDDRGLRILIEKGYYRAAINLTSHLLSNYSNSLGQPTKITNHSLQLWFTRLALLVKLGELEIVQTEAANFGMLDRPDMFYEFYPEMYNGKKGSMASFSFRLLLADLPQFYGAARASIDRLAYLNSIVDQICQHYEKIGYEDAKKFWRRRSRRVLHSIINAGLLVTSKKGQKNPIGTNFFDFRPRTTNWLTQS
jgi:trafficking protein particle complex subunit 12